MLRIVSTSEMRSIDRESINGDTDVGYSYMLKAAAGLYGPVTSMIRDRLSEQIAIVCGKGNNGGDGYVLGCMLIENGYMPMCFGLCDGEDLSGEAHRAYSEYIEKAGNFLVVDDVDELNNFSGYSLVVDAILGTGLAGDPRGVAAELIELMNTCGKPVIAADTPSGLNNDTGRTGIPTIKAQTTVAMGFAKIGQFFYPGREHVGNLVVADLGYPEKIIAQCAGSRIYMPEKQDLARMLPARRPDGSKFAHGLSFMLCGSRGMAGSACLAARAALRTGCGMVHLAAPRSLMQVLSIKLTETVIHGVEETDEGTVAGGAFRAVADMAGAMQAALVGPGLSHHPETLRLVRDFISRAQKPVVLDADGINAFKGCGDTLADRGCDLVLTPHEGEWQRLFGPLPADPHEKCAVLAQKAGNLRATIVYKGNPVLVACADGGVLIIPAGNSGMATAGSGDVLSGIIVSLIAQGCSAADAALLGVSLHGWAGVCASEKRGEYSMIASDMIENIHEAISMLAPTGAHRKL